ILQIASSKVDCIPVDRRELSHMTLAIDPKRLKAAKKMMREFVETFTTELTRGNQTSVYHLNLQFYPISEGWK
ncbi:MAG TPA: DUF4423 domain-containing protein, partial [Bdellovibrionales bacterium]|nr:DUF4423 domain-containing protein [Bdellovibrionales bacterium]